MKRIFAVLIVFAAIFQIYPASAANKAGGPCTRPNTTTTIAGSKYICLKSGTKLVWKITSKANNTSSSSGSNSTCSGEVHLGSIQKSRISESTAQFKFDAGKPCSYKYVVRDFEGNLIDSVEEKKSQAAPISIDLKNLNCDSIQKVMLTAYSKENGTGTSVSFPPTELAWCGWTNTAPNPTPSPKAEADCEGVVRIGTASTERTSVTEAKFKFDAQYPCSYKYIVKDGAGTVVESVGPINIRKTYISLTLSNLTCETRGTVTLTAYAKPNATGSFIDYPPNQIPWCS